MIRFEKITEDNYMECIKLKVLKEQENFVASNIMSLAEAYVSVANNYCIPMPYAIYHDSDMVGFIMLSFSNPQGPDDIFQEDVYYLWRLMIDQRYQGNGYGKEAVEEAIRLVKTLPYGPADKLVLSYEPENNTAEKLYTSLGFVKTGDVMEEELVAVLNL